MFNMFKHEDSVIFDPIWCSVIGSDISKSTGAPKKRFLEEYERDLSCAVPDISMMMRMSKALKLARTANSLLVLSSVMRRTAFPRNLSSKSAIRRKACSM